MLWDLFWTFFKIGCFSFGGGYAITPVIEREVTSHGWMTTAGFADAIAVAGMSPGPIATNSAIFVGYKTAGIAGALSATAGMIVPSLLIIVAVASFFYKVHDHKLVQSVFYGLRPVVTGLIAYAAIRFGMADGGFDAFTWQAAIGLVLLAAALFALLRYRVHPLVVLLVSGLAGVAIYS